MIFHKVMKNDQKISSESDQSKKSNLFESTAISIYLPEIIGNIYFITHKIILKTILQRMTLMHNVVKFLEKCKKFTIFRIEKNKKKNP
jgi:hypothetical protein